MNDAERIGRIEALLNVHLPWVRARADPEHHDQNTWGPREIEYGKWAPSVRALTRKGCAGCVATWIATAPGLRHCFRREVLFRRSPGFAVMHLCGLGTRLARAFLSHRYRDNGEWVELDLESRLDAVEQLARRRLREAQLRELKRLRIKDLHRTSANAAQTQTTEDKGLRRNQRKRSVGTRGLELVSAAQSQTTEVKGLRRKPRNRCERSSN